MPHSYSSRLESLQAKFHALVCRFDVHPAYKKFATSPTNDGGPHIEHHGHLYAFVVTERGIEYERRETTDPERILFWLVSHTTREAVQKYELENRVPGKDFRRLLFSKHIELLESIRHDWAIEVRAEYAAVLQRHPYNDML